MTTLADKVYAVTGATGHLGINLVLELLAAGSSVRAITHRREVPGILRGRDQLSFKTVDILEPTDLAEAVSGVDGVFHLAGKVSIDGDRDGSVWRCNVEGAKNVATACLRAEVPRLIHCGSVHALKVEPSTLVLDETLELSSTQHERPVYDRSKAAGLEEVEKLRQGGLSVVSVLPSGVIGPHDPAPSRMGRVFQALQQRKLPALTGGAFDFVDVRDVAEGMLRAMAMDAPQDRYVLGGHFMTLVDLIRRAADQIGVVAPRLVAPLSWARLSAPLALSWAHLLEKEPLYTPESIQTLSLGRPTDSSRARNDLGYRPRPIDETIRDVFASFESPSAAFL